MLLDGLLLGVPQLDQGLGVLAQVGLGANQDHWHLAAVGAQLGDPLLTHVVEGGGQGHTEAEEKHVGVGVDQGPQRVKVVLARRVAQLEGQRLAVDMHDGVVRVNGRRNVLVRVAVGCVRDDERGLAHGAVADKHTFDFVSIAGSCSRCWRLLSLAAFQGG